MPRCFAARPPRRSAHPMSDHAAKPEQPPFAWRRFLLSWFAMPSAAIAALLVGALMMAALGADPVTGYRALLSGAFGSRYALGSTAVKAVPLLLVGVGICIAFRANVFNIGGEGQIAMGGLAGTAVALSVPGLPAPVLDPARPARRRRRRRRLGGDPGRLQGLLQRQRDPEHDHAEPRRRPADELPARRPDGRQVADGLGRRADPADPAPPEELVAADPRPGHAAPPRRARRGR